MLECQILVKQITSIGYPNQVALLEVELKNVSDQAIEISYTYAPAILQYMKREDRRPDGTFGKINCMNGLSPYSLKPTILSLMPGQATRAHFGCVGTTGPGTYQVQAIFEYDKLKVFSPPIKIELKETKENQ
jgi:hypothetical protein